jgi:hypothetical protein
MITEDTLRLTYPSRYVEGFLDCVTCITLDNVIRVPATAGELEGIVADALALMHEAAQGQAAFWLGYADAARARLREVQRLQLALGPELIKTDPTRRPGSLVLLDDPDPAISDTTVVPTERTLHHG